MLYILWQKYLYNFDLTNNPLGGSGPIELGVDHEGGDGDDGDEEADADEDHGVAHVSVTR